MGRRIAALAIESGQFDLAAALEAGGHGSLGEDVGELAGVGAFGVNVGETLDAEVDVLIDFSRPEGTLQWLDACRRAGVAMVIGTTGLTESGLAEIADAAGEVAIVHAANMSPGINLLLKLVPEVAAALGEEYDIEIAETHHRFKADAPSGTALALARAICEATGKEPDDTITHGRSGKSLRKTGEIGVHAIRLGDTVGEHAVSFGNLGETITISHSAHTRDVFARGALRAAGWLAKQKPGLYSMRDVLGL